jgi:hypothetical protein
MNAVILEKGFFTEALRLWTPKLACAGDRSLRGKAEALLKAHEPVEDLLELLSLEGKIGTNGRSIEA